MGQYRSQRNARKQQGNQAKPTQTASEQKEASLGCSSVIDPRMLCVCKGKTVHSRPCSPKRGENVEKQGQGDKKTDESSPKKEGNSVSNTPEAKKSSKSLKQEVQKPSDDTSANLKNKIELNKEPKKPKRACLLYMVQCLMPLCKLPTNNNEPTKPVDNLSKASPRSNRSSSRQPQKKKSVKNNALNISLPKHSNMKISIQMLPKPKSSTSDINKPASCSSKKSINRLFSPKLAHDEKSKSNLKSLSNLKALSSKSSFIKRKSNKKCKSILTSSQKPNASQKHPVKTSSGAKQPILNPTRDPNTNYVMLENQTELIKSLGSYIESLKNCEEKINAEIFKDQYNEYPRRTENLNSEMTPDNLKKPDALSRIRKHKISKSKFTGRSKNIPPPASPPEDKNDVFFSTVQKTKGMNHPISKTKKISEYNWSKAKKNLQSLNQILEVSENSDGPLNGDSYNVKPRSGIQPSELYPGNDVLRRSTYTLLKPSFEGAKEKSSPVCVVCRKINCKKNCSQLYKQKAGNFQQSLQIYNQTDQLPLSHSKKETNSKSQFKFKLNNCGQKHPLEKIDFYDCKHSKLQSETKGLKGDVSGSINVSGSQPRSDLEFAQGERLDPKKETDKSEKKSKVTGSSSKPVVSDRNSVS